MFLRLYQICLFLFPITFAFCIQKHHCILNRSHPQLLIDEEKKLAANCNVQYFVERYALFLFSPVFHKSWYLEVWNYV